MVHKAIIFVYICLVSISAIYTRTHLLVCCFRSPRIPAPPCTLPTDSFFDVYPKTCYFVFRRIACTQVREEGMVAANGPTMNLGLLCPGAAPRPHLDMEYESTEFGAQEQYSSRDLSEANGELRGMVCLFIYPTWRRPV
jgi:hypothetical protein